jgi:hypothetical protein
MPWADRVGALPFMTARCPSARSCKERGRDSVTVGTRVRLDAALYAPAPARHAGQMGRPRQQGTRLPTLARVAADRQTQWQEGTGRDGYGVPQRGGEGVTGTCVW